MIQLEKQQRRSMSWENDNNQKRLTLWLPKTVHVWLKERATTNHVSMSKTIRRMIICMMLQEKRRDKE